MVSNLNGIKASSKARTQLVGEHVSIYVSIYVSSHHQNLGNVHEAYMTYLSLGQRGGWNLMFERGFQSKTFGCGIV